jgi:Ca-activated chloride channel family protein
LIISCDRKGQDSPQMLVEQNLPQIAVKQPNENIAAQSPSAPEMNDKKKPLISMESPVRTTKNIAKHSNQPYHYSKRTYDDVRHFSPKPIMNNFPTAIIDNKFEETKANKFYIVTKNPTSTFSSDIDSASYSFVKKSIKNGQLLNIYSVRPEEMINYFDYQYDLPKSAKKPFNTEFAIYPSPWNKNAKLLHIGVQGYDIKSKNIPKSNLVALARKLCLSPSLFNHFFLKYC